MATAIRLGRQRLRPEHGIGGSLNYEYMARQAGVMALRRTSVIPKQEQEKSVEDVVLSDERVKALAATAVAEEVIIVEPSSPLEVESELVDA